MPRTYKCKINRSIEINIFYYCTFIAAVAVICCSQIEFFTSNTSRMGDRSNPIKFGPEWLRNLAPGTSGIGNNNHNATMSSNTAGASGGPSGGNTPTSSNASNTANLSSKVLLAKLR